VAAAVLHVRSTAWEYARPRANVDAWLAGFAGLDEDEHGNVERFNRCAIPVMLLANGRTDEALEQVARYERSAPGDPGYRAFAQEVRAFVSSGAPMPEPSAEAFSYVGALNERSEVLQAELEALQAAGRDRDARSIAREWRGVAVVLGRLVRDRHAGRANTLAGWSPVALDADAQPVLDAAYDNADAYVLDTAFIDVTLTHSGTGMDVLIGDRHIGQITGVHATPGVVRGRVVRKRLPRRVELIVQTAQHEHE
jgi:hypothetical protein